MEAAPRSYYVRAEGFAPGTTEQDVAAVMEIAGGQLHYCKLVSSRPVIAEMAFANEHGAETVIDMFHGKGVCGTYLRETCFLC